MKSPPKMPQRAMVRIWVASLHQKSFNVTTTLEFFVLYVRETHECGRIRTAAALSQKTAQKQRGSRNPPAPTHLTAPVCKHTGAVLFLSAQGCSTSSKLRKTEHLSQTYHKKVTNRLFPLKKIVKRLFIWYHIGVAGQSCRSARRNESRSRRSIHEEKERSGFAAPGRCDVPDRMRRQRILH